MDVDLHKMLIFVIEFGMFALGILVVAVILCSWIIPCLHQMCINRYNAPEPENEEALEMEVVNREANMERPSHENEVETFNPEVHPTSTPVEG